eukprot:708023-Prymnesium_polylepis.1
MSTSSTMPVKLGGGGWSAKTATWARSLRSCWWPSNLPVGKTPESMMARMEMRVGGVQNVRELEKRPQYPTAAHKWRAGLQLVCCVCSTVSLSMPRDTSASLTQVCAATRRALGRPADNWVAARCGGLGSIRLAELVDIHGIHPEVVVANRLL